MDERQPSILDPDLAARLGKLTLRARQVVDGVLSGAHRSPHHGSSIEFAEHKEYAPGDELRHLDWKAYARFDRYYVKKFENETNLRGRLLVDASASMGYGEGELNKLDYARVLAAALAYLLLRQQDAPGLAIFRNGIEADVPPRSTVSHFQELAETLLCHEARDKTDLVLAIERVAEGLKGRNLVVVFSDFLDLRDDGVRLLARLAARKNDVAVFHVLHPHEIEFPFDLLTEFEDLEDGERILVEPDSIREEYRRVFAAYMKGLREACIGRGIGYQLARTDRPHVEPLLAFLQAREETA